MPARVLVLGRHAQMMQRVVSLLGEHGAVVVEALTDEAALEAMAKESALDAFLIGGGVEASSRPALKEAFARQHPGRPLVEHFGGPQGLVERLQAADVLPRLA